MLLCGSPIGVSGSEVSQTTLSVDYSVKQSISVSDQRITSSIKPVRKSQAAVPYLEWNTSDSQTSGRYHRTHEIENCNRTLVSSKAVVSAIASGQPSHEQITVRTPIMLDSGDESDGMRQIQQQQLFWEPGRLQTPNAAPVYCKYSCQESHHETSYVWTFPSYASPLDLSFDCALSPLLATSSLRHTSSTSETTAWRFLSRVESFGESMNEHIVLKRGNRWPYRWVFRHLSLLGTTLLYHSIQSEDIENTSNNRAIKLPMPTIPLNFSQGVVSEMSEPVEDVGAPFPLMKMAFEPNEGVASELCDAALQKGAIKSICDNQKLPQKTSQEQPKYLICATESPGLDIDLIQPKQPKKAAAFSLIIQTLLWCVQSLLPYKSTSMHQHPPVQNFDTRKSSCDLCKNPTVNLARGIRPITSDTACYALCAPFNGYDNCLVIFCQDDEGHTANEELRTESLNAPSDEAILDAFHKALGSKWVISCASSQAAHRWQSKIRNAKRLFQELSHQRETIVCRHQFGHFITKDDSPVTCSRRSRSINTYLKELPSDNSTRNVNAVTPLRYSDGDLSKAKVILLSPRALPLTLDQNEASHLMTEKGPTPTNAFSDVAQGSTDKASWRMSGLPTNKGHFINCSDCMYEEELQSPYEYTDNCCAQSLLDSYEFVDVSSLEPSAYNEIEIKYKD